MAKLVSQMNIDKWTDVNIELALKKKVKESSTWRKLFQLFVPQWLCIRMGYRLEDFYKAIVDTSPNFELVEIKKIEEKQVDILFKNKVTGNFYYYEIKSNLDLDSEKAPATADKVRALAVNIKDACNISEANLTSRIATPLWDQSDCKKAKKSLGSVVFMREVYSLLGITDTKEEYLAMWRAFGRKLLNAAS